MPKIKPGPAPHQIIFAGESWPVTLIDGKQFLVFVRELPARYHPLVFRHADNLASLVELCTYTKAIAGESAPAPLFAEVVAPTGYWPVPAGWADNVKPESHHALYDLAQKLNFTSAAATGKRQLAAKEWKAPLLREAEELLMPHVERLMHSLVSSLTPLSTAAASIATASSTKPSAG